MTEPVILKDCPECNARTLHRRDQRAEGGTIITDYICSDCGSVRTDKVRYADD